MKKTIIRISLITILLFAMLIPGYVMAANTGHPKPISPPPPIPDIDKMKPVELPNSTKVSVVDRDGNIIWEGNMNELQSHKEEIKQIFKARTGRDW